jgi:hypothetical protein
MLKFIQQKLFLLPPMAPIDQKRKILEEIYDEGEKRHMKSCEISVLVTSIIYSNMTDGCLELLQKHYQPKKEVKDGAEI